MNEVSTKNLNLDSHLSAVGMVLLILACIVLTTLLFSGLYTVLQSFMLDSAAEGTNAYTLN